MNNTRETIITQPDSFGRQWIYVTEAEVRSHKKGHFGIVIWMICLWFACVDSILFIYNGCCNCLELTGLGLLQ